MYRYVNDISELAQDIIRRYTRDFKVAIDCTLGNGHDCDFLKDHFDRVLAFDVQASAVEDYLKKDISNVEVFKDSHENLKNYIVDGADAIMFNLGYLPGANKDITTLCESTMIALKASLEIINDGGLITVAVYHGHDAGKVEKDEILKYLKELNPKIYGVMVHKYHNRSEFAPILIVIEKKLSNC